MAASPNVFPRFLKAGTEAISIYPRFLVDSFVSDVDITDPIHITQVAPGMVLRIAMRAGRHLDPVVGRTVIYQSATIRRQRGVPHPTPPPAHGGMTRMRAATKRKRTGNRARSFSRTTFLAFVTANDSVAGTLSVSIEARTSSRTPVQAIIAYADMRHVQRYIHQTTLRPEVGSRPGSIAFGSRSDYGFMKLVPVRFR